MTHDHDFGSLCPVTQIARNLLWVLSIRSNSGWWFQPMCKICSSNWKSSANRGENKKYLKPPPRNANRCKSKMLRNLGDIPRFRASGMLSTQTLHMMEMGKTNIRNLAKWEIFGKNTLFLDGGWTNPFEKDVRQIGSCPQVGQKNVFIKLSQHVGLVYLYNSTNSMLIIKSILEISTRH